MTSRAFLCVIALTAGCDWTMGAYCEGDWAANPPASAPPVETAPTVAQVLPAETSAVDILFVIDDSMSMADEQAQLGIWSGKMFEVLGTEDETLDLHVGVTSSSVAIAGQPGCEHGTGGSLEGRILRTREPSYTGTLTEAFAKIARLGDSGCGMEQPFKAARLALTHERDFLRDDALLLVVFVTDEDDCSSKSFELYGDPTADACSELGTSTSYRCFEHGVRCYDGKGSRALGARTNCRADDRSPYIESVQAFATYLKGLKANPAQVVVAAIYGKPNGVNVVRDERVTAYTTPRLADVCGGGGKEGTGATPGIRMNALLAEFGGRASGSSICDAELSWAMRDIGLVTRGAATRSRCLHGPMASARPACRVEGIRNYGTAEEIRTEIPPCDATRDTRCFTLAADAACTDSGLAFDVGGSAADETLTVRCEAARGASTGQSSSR